MVKAKPFIKWVGGKTQLIEQIEVNLPVNFGTWRDVTYIEPFVGGGAVLFHMLQHHHNITRAIINDINPDLINCYNVIKHRPKQLIETLQEIQKEYHKLNSYDKQKDFFLDKRSKFNKKKNGAIENAALFIFLNRTCFNGLYRVNKAGLFNVPFGKYNNPTICDTDTILADSELLQKVEILTGDFTQTLIYAEGTTIFYCDPPYRPLTTTAAFTSYSKEGFDDNAQIRLKNFCDLIQAQGYSFILSNSDGKGNGSNDCFFDNLYINYQIERVFASRSINSIGSKRGKLSEILVRNYPETLATAHL